MRNKDRVNASKAKKPSYTDFSLSLKNLDTDNNKKSILVGGISRDMSISKVIKAFEVLSQDGIKNFDLYGNDKLRLTYFHKQDAEKVLARGNIFKLDTSYLSVSKYYEQHDDEFSDGLDDSSAGSTSVDSDISLSNMTAIVNDYSRNVTPIALLLPSSDLNTSEKTPDHRRVLITNMPLPIVSEWHLHLYLEFLSDNVDIERYDVSTEINNALVATFKNNIEFDKMKQRHRERPLFLDNKTTLLPVYLPQTVVVQFEHSRASWPTDAAFSKEILELYFSNPKRSGGKNVKSVILDGRNARAFVTFSNHETANLVAGRKHTIDNSKVTVHLYYESIGVDPFSKPPKLDRSDGVVHNNGVTNGHHAPTNGHSVGAHWQHAKVLNGQYIEFKPNSEPVMEMSYKAQLEKYLIEQAIDSALSAKNKPLGVIEDGHQQFYEPGKNKLWQMHQIEASRPNNGSIKLLDVADVQRVTEYNKDNMLRKLTADELSHILASSFTATSLYSGGDTRHNVDRDGKPVVNLPRLDHPAMMSIEQYQALNANRGRKLVPVPSIAPSTAPPTAPTPRYQKASINPAEYNPHMLQHMQKLAQQNAQQSEKSSEKVPEPVHSKIKTIQLAVNRRPPKLLQLNSGTRHRPPPPKVIKINVKKTITNQSRPPRPNVVPKTNDNGVKLRPKSSLNRDKKKANTRYSLMETNDDVSNGEVVAMLNRSKKHNWKQLARSSPVASLLAGDAKKKQNNGEIAHNDISNLTPVEIDFLQNTSYMLQLTRQYPLLEFQLDDAVHTLHIAGVLQQHQLVDEAKMKVGRDLEAIEMFTYQLSEGQHELAAFLRRDAVKEKLLRFIEPILLRKQHQHAADLEIERKKNPVTGSKENNVNTVSYCSYKVRDNDVLVINTNDVDFANILYRFIMDSIEVEVSLAIPSQVEQEIMNGTTNWTAFYEKHGTVLHYLDTARPKAVLKLTGFSQDIDAFIEDYRKKFEPEPFY